MTCRSDGEQSLWIATAAHIVAGNAPRHHTVFSLAISPTGIRFRLAAIGSLQLNPFRRIMLIKDPTRKN